MMFWYELQNSLNIFAVVACLILTASTVQRMLRYRLANRVMLFTIGYLVSFSLAMLSEINALYIWIDSLTKINNLAWFLAWTGFIWTLHFIAQVINSVYHRFRKDWLAFTVLVWLVQAGIFFIFIRVTPENPIHVLPRDLADFWFMQSLFLYAIAFIIIILRGTQSLQNQETAWLQRSRISLSVLLFSIVLVIFILRVVITSAPYLSISQQVVEFLYAVSVLGLIVMGGMMILPLLPPSVLMVLLSPITTFKKMQRLKDLLVIRDHVQEFYPPILPPEKLTWWQYLLNLNFHIFHTTVTILDGKATLALSDGVSPKGAELLELLIQVDDNVDFATITENYRRIGAHLRHNRQHDKE